MKRTQLMMMWLLLSLCPLWAQVTGSGKTNYIPVWVGTSAIGDSIMFQTDSRIGINTTSPQYALDVGGHINTSAGYLIGESVVLSQPGGNSNLSVGYGAMSSVGDAYQNTAVGSQALASNSGVNNTGCGFGALFSNTIGTENTALGVYALGNNTGGNNNTAIGSGALQLGSGSNNTAVGLSALFNNLSGGSNIAIGFNAGFNNPTSASNNIDIGSEGSSSDSGAIRVGTSGSQTSFFAAGIRGVTTGENNAALVVIDSNGQLGTISSSRRFKTDIQDMGDASSGLMRLRPVTFRYKKPFADGSQPLQYGLIAEEVAEVYPDLVARSADGEIETVKYQVLDSLLLNELQRQRAEIRELQEQLKEMKSAVAAIAHAPEAPQIQTTISQTSAAKGE